MTTCAPSRESSSATARPMPLLAPVTSATLSVSCRSMACNSEPRRLRRQGSVLGGVEDQTQLGDLAAGDFEELGEPHRHEIRAHVAFVDRSRRVPDMELLQHSHRPPLDDEVAQALEEWLSTDALGAAGSQKNQVRGEDRAHPALVVRLDPVLPAVVVL